MNVYESDMADDVYDYLFENKTHVSFIEEFPNSWVDNAHACVYLGLEQNKPVFKIKIERI